jgi:hypothetical protein
MVFNKFNTQWFVTQGAKSWLEPFAELKSIMNEKEIASAWGGNEKVM